MSTPPQGRANRSRDVSQPVERLHDIERLKAGSNYLRGSIAQGLVDPLTWAIDENDNKLLKFFGIYLQDDRDLRDERRRQKLEPAWQFMVRLRLPGGLLTPRQWLQLDALAHSHGNAALRITDRQTFQFHGVVKPKLKPLIQGFREVGLDTLAACGDDSRGVMAAPAPHRSHIHREVHELAAAVSAHLRPRTSAYREIWYDERPTGPDHEPLYGPTYLPRKFKIGFAVPPANDIDVYAQDLGFIAIIESGRLAGFNVTVGGGMGRTDNAPHTYPRLGDVIGFVTPAEVLAVAEHTMTIQRDYGDRVDRHQARFKYTLDERGLEWFVAELQQRAGFRLQPVRPYRFERNTDEFGWVQGDDGAWHFTLFIRNGRIRDLGPVRLMSALRAIAATHRGEFRLTPNQNVVIARVAAADRERIGALLAGHGVVQETSLLQRNAVSCVALPTCGLAMAESERYLPDLVVRIEALMREAGVADQPVTIRMSGCPNGCSRPYIAEIGFTGRAPGKYNMYLGGGAHGQRLNRMYLENAGEDRILAALAEMFRRYAAERLAGEPFGDFVVRAAIVREVRTGRDFNG
ncbi:MAG: NADPH-dependent assimilatory sulfite reductase hemoprotein subunit [Gammaproteobacteria bacterium]|nr:MAG: NADPH-dependent assimilatory sulfite reductase hemoprotein subunit [Gammaproteobacteria bacterium]